MRAGDDVYLRRSAKGRFLLDAHTRDHLMIASVTGVAPFVSMLRDLVRNGESTRRVFFLHSASEPAELGYVEELAALSESLPWFDYIPTVSRPWLAPDWLGERGRAEDVVRKYADARGFRPGCATVYCCGNPPDDPECSGRDGAGRLRKDVNPRRKLLEGRLRAIPSARGYRSTRSPD